MSQRKRFRVVPVTKEYEFEVPNRFEADPATIILELVGYAKGPGCPAPVFIEVDEALATAQERTPEDPGPERRGYRYVAAHNRVDRELRRDLLCAVIPGLDPEDANYVAGDGGPWEEILVELGWWIKVEPEGEASGEATDRTGESSSPSSAPTGQA